MKIAMKIWPDNFERKEKRGHIKEEKSEIWNVYGTSPKETYHDILFHCADLPTEITQ